jgi:hypothetical protein
MTLNGSCNADAASVDVSPGGKKCESLHIATESAVTKHCCQPPNTASCIQTNKNEFRGGFSPQANYTDLATAAVRTTFAGTGCCVISAEDSHGRLSCFSR